MTVQGLGYLGIGTDKLYCDLLGFRISDYIRKPITSGPHEATWSHCVCHQSGKPGLVQACPCEGRDA